MTAAAELAVEQIKLSITHNLKGLTTADARDMFEELIEHCEAISDAIAEAAAAIAEAADAAE